MAKNQENIEEGKVSTHAQVQIPSRVNFTSEWDLAMASSGALVASASEEGFYAHVFAPHEDLNSQQSI